MRPRPRSRGGVAVRGSGSRHPRRDPRVRPLRGGREVVGEQVAVLVKRHADGRAAHDRLHDLALRARQPGARAHLRAWRTRMPGVAAITCRRSGRRRRRSRRTAARAGGTGRPRPPETPREELRRLRAELGSGTRRTVAGQHENVLGIVGIALSTLSEPVPRRIADVGAPVTRPGLLDGVPPRGRLVAVQRPVRARARARTARLPRPPVQHERQGRRPRASKSAPSRRAPASARRTARAGVSAVCRAAVKVAVAQRRGGARVRQHGHAEQRAAPARRMRGWRAYWRAAPPKRQKSCG